MTKNPDQFISYSDFFAAQGVNAEKISWSKGWRDKIRGCYPEELYFASKPSARLEKAIDTLMPPNDPAYLLNPNIPKDKMVQFFATPKAPEFVEYHMSYAQKAAMLQSLAFAYLSGKGREFTPKTVENLRKASLEEGKYYRRHKKDEIHFDQDLALPLYNTPAEKLHIDHVYAFSTQFDERFQYFIKTACANYRKKVAGSGNLFAANNAMSSYQLTMDAIGDIAKETVKYEYNLQLHFKMTKYEDESGLHFDSKPSLLAVTSGKFNKNKSDKSMAQMYEEMREDDDLMLKMLGTVLDLKDKHIKKLKEYITEEKEARLKYAKKQGVDVHGIKKWFKPDIMECYDYAIQNFDAFNKCKPQNRSFVEKVGGKKKSQVDSPFTSNQWGKKLG